MGVWDEDATPQDIIFQGLRVLVFILSLPYFYSSYNAFIRTDVNIHYRRKGKHMKLDIKAELFNHQIGKLTLECARMIVSFLVKCTGIVG